MVCPCLCNCLWLEMKNMAYLAHSEFMERRWLFLSLQVVPAHRVAVDGSHTTMLYCGGWPNSNVCHSCYCVLFVFFSLRVSLEFTWWQMGAASPTAVKSRPPDSCIW